MFIFISYNLFYFVSSYRFAIHILTIINNIVIVSQVITDIIIYFPSIYLYYDNKLTIKYMVSNIATPYKNIFVSLNKLLKRLLISLLLKGFPSIIIFFISLLCFIFFKSFKCIIQLLVYMQILHRSSRSYAKITYHIYAIICSVYVPICVT